MTFASPPEPVWLCGGRVVTAARSFPPANGRQPTQPPGSSFLRHHIEIRWDFALLALTWGAGGSAGRAAHQRCSASICGRKGRGNERVGMNERVHPVAECTQELWALQTRACPGLPGRAMRPIVGRLCQQRGRCGKGEAVGTQPRAGQGVQARSHAGHRVAWAPVGACPREICECPVHSALLSPATAPSPHPRSGSHGPSQAPVHPPQVLPTPRLALLPPHAWPALGKTTVAVQQAAPTLDPGDYS